MQNTYVSKNEVQENETHLYFNHNQTFGIAVSLSRLFVATLGKFTEVKANARSHSVSKRKSSFYRNQGKFDWNQINPVRIGA